MGARTDEERLGVDMYAADRDVNIRARSVKIVTVRKPQFCAAHREYKGDTVYPGTRCLVERAVVDGAWCSSYTCIACVDAWLDVIDPPNRAARARRAKGRK